jgi:hypothetical protein
MLLLKLFSKSEFYSSLGRLVFKASNTLVFLRSK